MDAPFNVNPSIIIPFRNFIPISFLATFEFLKYFQGFFLEKEKIFMTKNEKLRVQSSSLNEDLGQINYLFSDKTGTLTKNKMIFRMLFANGKRYGEMEKTGQNDQRNINRKKVDLVDFNDEKIFQDLTQEGEKKENLL